MNIHNIYNKVYILPILVLLAMMLTGCYQTKNIPEDEYLYAGIKDFAYGHRWGEKERKNTDTTGVITAVADAYTAVEDVLRGNTSVVKEKAKRELTKEEQDSIRAQELIDKEAYNTARAEVAGALSYPPNGTIMGSSRWTHPFTIGLWVWNRYGQSESAFGKWMMNTLGATPKYISTVSPSIRTQVARNTLRNHGYFRGDVQYRIEDVKNPRKKKISYQILPGELFHLDSIEYRNFPLSIDTLIRQSLDETLLKRNAPFNVPTLSNERDRIATILRNHGHYYFRSDHIAYKADTLMRPEYVQLQVVPSPTMSQAAKQPFHIGKTRITVLKYNTRELTDSFSLR
ncbi:MAG: hypothetical protein II206_08910, partial [Bacteroidaceae bacterium]|nr:hypothetical protein [Bacteroidaceae bacterium]